MAYILLCSLIPFLQFFAADFSFMKTLSGNVSSCICTSQLTAKCIFSMFLHLIKYCPILLFGMFSSFLGHQTLICVWMKAANVPLEL